MPLSSFDGFPAEARLWIYAADRSLNPDEQEILETNLSDFFTGWRSHGKTVQGAAAVEEDRFLLIAGHVESDEISGCGIDSSIDVVEQAGRELDVEWLPALTVFYRDDEGKIHGVGRPTFREKVDEGVITRETPVFDLAVETVGQLREEGFERPAGASWHALVFRIPKAA